MSVIIGEAFSTARTVRRICTDYEKSIFTIIETPETSITISCVGVFNIGNSPVVVLLLGSTSPDTTETSHVVLSALFRTGNANRIHEILQSLEVSTNVNSIRKYPEFSKESILWFKKYFTC